MSLAELNAYLETGTLIVGLLAGLFALFFHARRWYRDRAPRACVVRADTDARIPQRYRAHLLDVHGWS